MDEFVHGSSGCFLAMVRMYKTYIIKDCNAIFDWHSCAGGCMGTRTNSRWPSRKGWIEGTAQRGVSAAGYNWNVGQKKFFFFRLFLPLSMSHTAQTVSWQRESIRKDDSRPLVRSSAVTKPIGKASSRNSILSGIKYVSLSTLRRQSHGRHKHNRTVWTQSVGNPVLVYSSWRTLTGASLSHV
jgi:hypothetical protein